MKPMLLFLLAITLFVNGFCQGTDSFYLKGNLLCRQGDYAAAVESYSKFISLNPGSRLCYISRGLAKGQLKDYEGAISDYSHAITIDPSIADAWYNRASIKSIMKDNSGAISDFKKVLEVDPGHVFAHVGIGGELFTLKDFAGAIAELDKAIALDPNNGPAYFIRGNIKMSRGQKDQGCADLYTALLAGYAPAGSALKESCQ